MRGSFFASDVPLETIRFSTGKSGSGSQRQVVYEGTNQSGNNYKSYSDGAYAYKNHNGKHSKKLTDCVQQCTKYHDIFLGIRHFCVSDQKKDKPITEPIYDQDLSIVQQ